MDFLVFFNKTINFMKRMPISKIVLVLKYQQFLFTYRRKVL